MEFVIEEVESPSFRLRVYEVRITDGAEYRRNQVQLAPNVDAQNFVENNIDDLWGGGQVVDAAWYLATKQRQAAQLMVQCQLAMNSEMLAGNGLAAMNATGQAVLAHNPEVNLLWQAYKNTLVANKGSLLSEHEIHNALVNFTVLSRQAAGR